MTRPSTLHTRPALSQILCACRRALALALVVVMLSVQTPAAPVMMVNAGREWKLNALLWFQASGWAATLRSLAAGQRAPAPQRQERQSEREARVRRIEIRPGEMEIALDERVQFTAVAYDQNEKPIGGIRFTWRGRDEGRNVAAQVTPTGMFVARATGNFKVTVEAAGRQAHVTVRVRAGEFRQRDEQPVKLRDVSTDDLPAQAAARLKVYRREQTNKQGQARATQSGRMLKASFNHAAKANALPAAAPLLPPVDDEFGWNSQNYMHSRNPDNRRGEPPGHPLDEGAGSSNFQLAAPVLSLPGRGIDLSLGLAYNSRVWTKAGNDMIFDADRDWPAPGWTLGFGRVVGMGLGGSLIIDPDGTRHGFGGAIFQYPSNGAVSFTGRTTDGTFIDYTTYSDGGGISSATAKLPNGTIILYGAKGQGDVYPTNLTDANGNFVTITYRNNAGPQIDIVTDTLGRTVKFHYDTNNLLTAIVGPGFGGTAGNPATRTLVRLHYRPATVSNTGLFASPLRAVVRNASVWLLDALYYSGTATGYWFGDADSSYSAYGMLAKVIEGRGMGFSGPEPSGTGPTEMGTVTPGQMTRQQDYDYPLALNPGLGGAPTYSNLTERWTIDGTNIEQTVTNYVFERNVANPARPGVPSRRVQITRLADGVKSVQWSYNYTDLAETDPNKFKDGLVYQDETQDASGNVLQGSTVTEWQKGAYDSPRPTRVEVTDDRGQKTAAEFTYGDPYNQVIKVRDFDYGGVTPLRVTRTEYVNGAEYTNPSLNIGRHIFNLVKAVEVYTGDEATRVSRTEYQYDGATLINTPGVTMHSDAFNPHAQPYCYPDPDDPDCLGICPDGGNLPGCDGECRQICDNPYRQATDKRGNVTQVTTYANAAPPTLTGALTETRTYDITGNLRTASTSCCEQTSVEYTVDTQFAYPERQTRGAASAQGPRVSTLASYDFNTGLVLTGTDANGRLSQTFYYAETLRPWQSYSPTGARTEYAYDDAGMTVTETAYTDTNQVAAQSVKRLNGNGQIRREEAKGEGANVWDVVETKYDVFGRVKEQSRPFRSRAESPQWTKTFYNEMGRVFRVEAPDGSVTRTFYNEANYPPAATQGQPGQTVRVVDAWERERWGRTDAQGRLVEGVEPNPYGGGAVSEADGLLTSYVYDTPGNLREVVQGNQRRQFRYDDVGRLTHQKLAETTATINDAGQFVGAGGGGAQWGDYFEYDERSNLTARTDARGVRTNFSYNNDP
ncbi:MAG: hypothetical protein LC742_08870, partial [Acidobacteria bacterium]|nr:hypothetical protein [Acidobacteriota bacterium]